MDLSDIAAITGSSSSQEAARPLQRPRIAAHGLDNRGLEAASPPGSGFGRFGRMFPFSGGELPDQCLRDIAEAMIKIDPGGPIDFPEPVDENPLVPAGYTYFGQFVDHDITLDPTPLKARSVDVAALTDFRTPALDLDCVYGRGPDDQPYMYEPDGLHLRLGDILDDVADKKKTRTRRDVLRLADPNGQPPPSGKGARPAILGDKRNDENRIVVQVQSAFISFHNKVVDDQDLIETFDGVWADSGSRFRTATNIVRWHYQWLVLHDYLNRILEPTIIDEILGPSGTPSLPNYAKDEAHWAYMPVEFAGAAYRFGHSMVRPGYALNDRIGADRDKEATGDEDTTKQPNRIPIFSEVDSPFANLNGFGFDLPKTWGIDWSFFFDGLDTSGLPEKFVVPQPSYRMDAQLVSPLKDLPEFRGQPDPLRSLAYRNLVRGVANLRLPSGEQVARALQIDPLPPNVLWSAGSRTVFKTDAAGAITRLPDTEIKALIGDDLFEDFADTDARRAKVLNAWVVADKRLKGNTPLWYYVLREGEYYGNARKAEGPSSTFGGQHLGPVGSRIIGETFVGLLWNDSGSYLRRWPTFKPHPKIAGSGKFTVGALLKYVLAT